MKLRTKYTKLNRRGYEITLPTDLYTSLAEQKVYIGLVKRGSSMTVQCTQAGKYICTLKSIMDVAEFKNGNPCDFHTSNLIYNKD